MKYCLCLSSLLFLIMSCKTSVSKSNVSTSVSSTGDPTFVDDDQYRKKSLKYDPKNEVLVARLCVSNENPNTPGIEGKSSCTTKNFPIKQADLPEFIKKDVRFIGARLRDTNFEKSSKVAIEEYIIPCLIQEEECIATNNLYTIYRQKLDEASKSKDDNNDWKIYSLAHELIYKYEVSIFSKVWKEGDLVKE